MKPLIKALLGLTATLLSLQVFSQASWDVRGNTADSSYFLGTTNNEILRIKTDSIDRIIVGVNDSIKFYGTALFDSVVIPTGHLQADSIRARVIHVGDSSMVLGAGFNVAGANVIRTTNAGTPTLLMLPFNGLTSFLRDNAANMDNARVGIGIQTPNNQLQLWRNSAVQVVSQYTNSNTGGAAATEGFLVGIAASGAAVLSQQENAFIDVFTNSTVHVGRMASFTSGSAQPEMGFVFGI